MAASDLADLTTLHSQRAGFSTLENITAITLTNDGGGGDGDVNFGDLDTIVNSYQGDINAGVAFSFQAGDTIDIDSSDELSAYVTDIGSGAACFDKSENVTVDSSVGVSVANAKSVQIHQGTVTATITSSSRVSDLTELRDPDGAGAGANETNAWTITIDGADASTTSAALNTIDDATSVAVNAATVTSLTGTAESLTTLFTSVTNGTITGIDGAETTISSRLMRAHQLPSFMH